jgi:plasmid maintenance system antidote protein VapI
MHNPPHPGEVLREYLPEGMSVTGAAKRLGVSAEMALRLSDALGTGAEMWIRMQAGYDLWQAEQKPRPKIERFLLAT